MQQRGRREPLKGGGPRREGRQSLGRVDLHERCLREHRQLRSELGRRGGVREDPVVGPVVEDRPLHRHPHAKADDRARPSPSPRDPGRERMPDAEERSRARGGGPVPEPELDRCERCGQRIDRVDRQRRAAHIEREIVGERTPRRIGEQVIDVSPEERPAEDHPRKEIRRVPGRHGLHGHLEIGREADRPNRRRRSVREAQPQVEIRRQGVHGHDGIDASSGLRSGRVREREGRAPCIPAVANAGSGLRERAPTGAEAAADGGPFAAVRSLCDSPAGAAVAQLDEGTGLLRERQPVGRGLEDEDVGCPIVEADAAPGRRLRVERIGDRAEDGGGCGNRRPGSSPPHG